MDDLINQQLLAQLKRHEGICRSAYTDHLGYLTIGIGRLIDERKGGGISDEEALYLLQNDLQECVKDLSSIPAFARLDAIRQQALINMRFQLGGAGLRAFKRMWAALDQQDYKQAAIEALDSKWARQTPERAKEIAEQLRTGVMR